MTSPFSTYAFISGEIDRAFYSRTDLDKYPLGVATAQNFTIDFRGGLKSRPGFRFFDYIGEIPRAFEFFVSEDDPPIIVCIVDERIYFWSDDSFLIDDTHTITNVVGFDFTIADASGISIGDYLYAGTFPYLLRVKNKVSNTLTLEMLDTQTPPGIAEIGDTLRPLLFLPSPYTTADLPGLTAHFRLNKLVICHPNYEPRALEFENDTFTLSAERPTSVLSQPTGISVVTYSRSGAGGTEHLNVATGGAVSIFVVTALDADGNESLPSRPFRATSMFNYTVAGGNAVISWTPVAGAASYRVYRSIITENNALNIGAETGFIGETQTPSFTDNNFIPNFTQQPPRFFNPFSTSSILRIDMTANGSGYNPNTSTVTIADGTGFIGYPIVEPGGSGTTPPATGPIVGVLIYSGGTGYTTSSAVTFAGAGTLATAVVADVSPADGTFPRVSTVFQQRRVFAGPRSLPLTIFASQPGAERNFNSASPPIDSDAYILSLDAREVIPVRHLLPMRSGLLIMNSRSIYRLFGRDDGAVTPNSFVFEPQAELGVGTAEPVVINNDVLFASARGTAFHSLAYTFYTNSFAPQEISVLAPHLFGKGKEPVRIVWCEEPDKIAWILRADGKLLSLTYMKEQEVYAWAHHVTDGLVKEICQYSRPDRDSLILFIDRDGKFFVEELAPREVSPLSEYWGSDASLGFSFESPTTEVTGLWHLEGRTVQILADSDVQTQTLVTGGRIEIENPASVFRIGLPFECFAASLPLTNPQVTVDGRLRRIVGSAVRLLETRGLEIGTAPNKLKEMRDKGWEDFGDPIPLRSDNSFVLHRARWERDAQIFFRQRYPLPAFVLGYVTEAETER